MNPDVATSASTIVMALPTTLFYSQKTISVTSPTIATILYAPMLHVL